MKRKFVSLMIVAALSFGMTTIAANHGKAAKDKTEQTFNSNKKCPKGDKKDRGPRGECKGEGRCDSLRADRFDPFAGITLTDAQKSQLEALRPGCPGEKPEMKEGEGKCKCPKCDSTATRPDPREQQREFLGKIKEILTADQYVTFLENQVLNQQAGQPGQPGRPGEFGPGQPGQPGGCPGGFGPGQPGQPGQGQPGGCCPGEAPDNK